MNTQKYRTQRLKRCPFCGAQSDDEKAYPYVERSEDVYVANAQVKCSRCGASSAVIPVERKSPGFNALGIATNMAIEAWNERA